jgi:hypothetical protein
MILTEVDRSDPGKIGASDQVILLGSGAELVEINASEKVALLGRPFGARVIEAFAVGRLGKTVNTRDDLAHFLAGRDIKYMQRTVLATSLRQGNRDPGCVQ